VAASKQRTICVDIGGSGIKSIVLDAQGKALTERLRTPTPQPATPEAVLALIADQAARQGPFDRIACGFPGVVRHGIIETAHNLDKSWIGFQVNTELKQLLGKPARAANDADVQGLAVIEGKGLELMLTLGTGLGSALFVNGILAPNLEVAHHPFRKGRTYEQLLGDAARKRAGGRKWNRRVREAIEQLAHLFNYDILYIGGGNASKVYKRLPGNVQIVPNLAGLYGGIALWNGPSPS